ncbi:MAG: phosphoglycerate kinase [bacterium]
MKKLSVRDLSVAGKRVFVRADLNVPLDSEGKIVDDTRIRAALPTICWLRDAKSTVVIGSHFGKPKGQFNPKLSLRPVALHLEMLMGQGVYFLPDCVGPEVVKLLKAVPYNSVVLLENLRFHPEEEKNDRTFAKSLTALVDLYVNDAFGAAHRAHASTAGMASFFSKPAAGFLMEKEIYFLGNILQKPQRPFVVLIGGAKISDKAGVIKNLLPMVDRLLVGGGVAFNFLKAAGYNIGKSLYEEQVMPETEKLVNNQKIVLPIDVRIEMPGEDKTDLQVKVSKLPDDAVGLDIGDQTIDLWVDTIIKARTIVWAGPMGKFEKQRFSRGTLEIARAVAEATRRGATTVVGGGDTVAAVKMAGVASSISHISTGGGATLEFLEGKVLPGVAALSDKI